MQAPKGALGRGIHEIFLNNGDINAHRPKGLQIVDFRKKSPVVGKFLRRNQLVLFDLFSDIYQKKNHSLVSSGHVSLRDSCLFR